MKREVYINRGVRGVEKNDFKGNIKGNNKDKSSLILEFISGSSTPVVSQERAQRQAWKTLKQVQGLTDFTITKIGFTLIELLVVVLIIGILAAIALPQYQRAVLRSTYKQFVALGDSLAAAEERYYLEHGSYTPELSELDITMSEPVRTAYNYGKNRGNKIYYFDNYSFNIIDKRYDAAPRVIVQNDRIRYDRWLRYDNTYNKSKHLAGKQSCHAQDESRLSHSICQQESKLTTPSVGKRYDY